MKVHFLIHEAAEMPGAILSWTEKQKHHTSFTLLYKGEALPACDQFDALVIMGGPMNIYEEDRYPWLKAEKLFIKQAIEADKKILGICLGSQLLADALGSKVFRNKCPEIGWFPVYLTTDGLNSPLFDNITFSEPVLHWHGDTFIVPDGATHLLSSIACQSQAFSYGNNVLALQFHFETTFDSLKDMTELDRASLVKSEWVMTENEILEGIQYVEANNRILYELLNRFLYK